MSYRFSYARKVAKGVCPKCQQKTFVLYQDNATGELLDSQYGHCDRLNNCDYHNPPDYHELVGGKRSAISKKIMDRSMIKYEQNNFVLFLKDLFGIYLLELMKKYHIGTIERYSGGCLFWYLDINGVIRSGKLMGYDRDGHRVKGQTNWVHSLMYGEDFNFKQTFFGEHLLSYNPGLPVAIVESEKTAIVCEGFIPGVYNWISCGSVHGMGGKDINWEKCKVLEGLDVVLFPDLDKQNKAMNIWKGIAEKMQGRGINARVDYTLEQNYTKLMKAKGADLADYFIDNVAYNPERGNHTILPHLIDRINKESKFYSPF